MTAFSRTDLLASLDVSFREDLDQFKSLLQQQENLNESTLQAFIPQSRLLLLRKILSRMLTVCLDEPSVTQMQELKILGSVVENLIASGETPLSATQAQQQSFEKTTAEFSKTIANKERLIADQITKSQQHIAGLQKKMTAGKQNPSLNA